MAPLIKKKDFYKLLTFKWHVSKYEPNRIISLQISVIRRLIALVGRVFANGPGDLCSIPGHVIPKTLKILHDTSLLNTQQYKARIKGKVEQSRETRSALPLQLSVVAIEKEPSDRPRLRSTTLLLELFKWSYFCKFSKPSKKWISCVDKPFFSHGKNTVQAKQLPDKYYSDSAPSETRVKRSNADFKRGHTDTNDAERSVRPNQAVVPENIKTKHKLVWVYRK